MDLSAIRKEYSQQKLNEKSVNNVPLKQLEQWLSEAQSAECNEYTAMSIATVDANGQPSIRTVLLKYLDNSGLLFFTNYSSRKGQELAQNSKIAAHFFWPELERQVRIEGNVEKTNATISDKYFYSRPFESQISAIISPQSQEVPNREFLESLRETEIAKNLNQVPERPNNWGGYRIIPSRIEFWQGGNYRLHDRILYDKNVSNWKITRLAP